MNNILFLTDFSEVAENAFIYALSLAYRANAELHILHIVPIIEPDDPAEENRIHPFAKLYNNNLEAEEWAEFKAEAAKLELIATQSKHLDVSVVFHFQKGYFLEEVQQFSNKLAIELIVMGSSGTKTIEKQFFGSHTTEILDLLNIPILAVPEGVNFNGVENFTLAVLLDKKEKQVLVHLHDTIKKLGLNFRCVHVAGSKQQVELKVKQWQEMTRLADTIVDIVYDGDVKRGLERYMKENRTDVLCILHRDLSPFKRIFKLNHSKIFLWEVQTALLLFKI